MGERRQHRHREGVDVIERQHGEHAVRGPRPCSALMATRVGGEVALRQHHALRLAGGAGGVHEQARSSGPGPARRCRPADAAARVGAGQPRRRRHRRRSRVSPIVAADGRRAAPRTRALPFRARRTPAAVRMPEHVAHLLGLRQQVDRVRPRRRRAARRAAGARCRPFGITSDTVSPGSTPCARSQRRRAAVGARVRRRRCARRASVATRVDRVGPARRGRSISSRTVRGAGRRGGHAAPYFSKWSPKISCSVGTRSGIGREMRVMLR